MSTHLLLLQDIAALIGESRSLDEVLDRVVRLVADRMQTSVCSIWLLDGAQQKAVLRASQGLHPEAIGRATLARGQGLTWAVIEKREPVIIEDAPRDPRYVYIPATREEVFHSFLAVPLLVHGAPIGTLSVQTREPRIFTEDEVRALSTIASQIAPVVDNARLLSLIAAGEAGGAPAPVESGPKRARGTGCSGSVVSGRILRLGTRPAAPPPARGPPEEELARLARACAKARAELLRMQHWLRERHAEEAAFVFTVQLMMLEDVSFEGRMREAVARGAAASTAIEEVTADLLARFARLDDSYFRERGDDVRDLAGRLMRHAQSESGAAQRVLEGRIVVLPHLAPSRMVSLCAEGAAAVLTGGGGATSHAALLARSLDLPLVVGLGDFLNNVRDGQEALVDAASGEVVLDPPAGHFEEARRTATAGVEALRRLAVPASGGSRRMLFEANVSLWGDAVRAVAEEADGIGLYRTEFIYLMRPDLPGEDEQYVLYRRVVEEVAPKAVTFRLLDAGGDKLLPALGPTPEPNPFLGYRSLRLLLDHPEILGAQARAILYALEQAPGRILVPMVGSVDEFRAVRTLLASEEMEMPELGAMVEVPSALFQIEELAREADFLSIGTNDLTQHLLGVDRTNARVTRWFDFCHPAMLRALHLIARAAHAARKPLTVCGEAASNPLFLPVWLGLGVARLSVHARRVSVLRGLEARLDAEEARSAVEEALRMESASAIRARLIACAAPEVIEYLRRRGGA